MEKSIIYSGLDHGGRSIPDQPPDLSETILRALSLCAQNGREVN